MTVLDPQWAGGVDHQHCHVGTVDHAQRPQKAVIVGVLGGPGTAHPRGVDQQHRSLGSAEEGVDRVPGRARHGADQRPVLPQEDIEQGRFTHVRTSDDGTAQQIAGLLRIVRSHPRPLRELVQDPVEQISGSDPRQGADLHRIPKSEG